MKVDLPRCELKINFPLGEEPPAVPARKIEVSLRSPSDANSAATITRLRDGLQKHHAQLGCGRHVETNSDAVRWLLERVYEASRPR